MKEEEVLSLPPSDPLAKALSALTELLAALYLVKKKEAAAVVLRVITVIHRERRFNEAELPKLLKEAAYEELGDEKKAGQALADLLVWVSACLTGDLRDLARWAAEYIKANLEAPTGPSQ